MSTHTPNYGLNIPENTDTMDDFFDDYEENMNIIDNNLGGGGGSANIDELTEADYDALPDTKYSDNVLYLLKDAISAEAPDVITLATCYSTSEREVGCWTDGKPLYQKTVHISALPDSTQIGQYIDYPHNIADIDTICGFEGVLHFPNGNALGPVRVGFSVPAGFNYQITIDSYCTVSYVRIAVGADRSNVSADYTIWYTKTTDSAGSGDWTPDGTPTVHYDNTEKVIGTWFGDTLYEKVISIPNTVAINNSFTYAHGITNLKIGMIERAFMYNPTNHQTLPMPLVSNPTQGTSYDKTIGVRIDATNISFAGINEFSANANRTFYVVVQYTKTS